MMGQRKSRGVVEIEALLDQLDPQSERYGILREARDFKVSWLALGECLTRAKESGIFQEWGYKTFETYAKNELHLRRETALKLTRSYAFLRDEEPATLGSEPSRSLPPLDVVDLLSQARERCRLDDAQWDSVRQEVMQDEAPTRRGVMQRLRDIDPEAFRRGAVPADAESPDADDDSEPRAFDPTELKKALALAERLRQVLEGQKVVPAGSVHRVRELIEDLRGLGTPADRKSA